MAQTQTDADGRFLMNADTAGVDVYLVAKGGRPATAKSGENNAAIALLSVLGRWQSDPGLAGVRDANSLARLPAAERAGWEKLWADVAAVLAEARKSK